ncbi:MAG: PhzF family phenazine biosynthesis protein [Deltaproteobacteria bacterium]|nr:PhzF family phenazine biosynthesis protein [Deltaproteobacteria bacterium]
MKVPMFQVDAFTGTVFGGNPAAICVLAGWLDNNLMQAIAAENNLSETAFLVKQGDGYGIRWFTPKAEIDLAGHPTLASAFVVFEMLEPGITEVRFETVRSGELIVRKKGSNLAMDFPSRPAKPCPAPEALVAGLGVSPVETLKSRDYLVVMESESVVRSVRPRFDLLETLDSLGVIITAAGDQVDFVSRFFAPKHGIPEDPVTGSAHCTLIPYWSNRLKKKNLHAHQVSARGGELFCEDHDERVSIAGQAALYFEGHIWI